MGLHVFIEQNGEILKEGKNERAAVCFTTITCVQHVAACFL